MSTSITMYSTPWCGYCHRLKSQLDREGIAFAMIDIEEHPEAAELVANINQGNKTVPTLQIASEATGKSVALTNPSVAQVKAAVAEVEAA